MKNKHIHTQSNQTVCQPPLPCLTEYGGLNESHSMVPDCIGLLCERAKSGDSWAQYMLGKDLLKKAAGRPKGTKTAREWLKKAAMQGHSGAKRALIDDLSGSLDIVADKEAMAWLYEIAETGDCVFQYQCAMVLPGTESFKWMKRAAEQKYITAMIMLAQNYLNGYGCDVDEREGFAWMNRAAETGNAEALALLGIMYAEGLGCEQSDERALQCLAVPVANQMDIALIAYGKMMEKRGTEEGYKEAIRHYEAKPKCCNGPSAAFLWPLFNYHLYCESEYRLGRMHQEGRGVPQSDSKAAKWYLQAIESACLNLGFRTFDDLCNYARWYKRDETKWCRALAKNGNAAAQAELGLRILGWGENKKASVREAKVWFERSAAQGNPFGQYCLGSLFMKELVPGKTEESEQWLRLAAVQGLPEAQEALGFILAEKGHNVESAKWYRLAAEQGLEYAQMAVGKVYYEGNGVEQNYSESAKWCRKALEAKTSAGKASAVSRHFESWRRDVLNKG